MLFGVSGGKIRKGNGKAYLQFCKPRPFKNISLEK